MWIKPSVWFSDFCSVSEALSCFHVSPHLLTHQESCRNSNSHLELPVMSWQQAQTVCPGEKARLRARASPQALSILSSSAHRIHWTLFSELSAPLLNWRVAHFPLSPYSPVCLKHTPNQHFEKPAHLLPAFSSPSSSSPRVHVCLSQGLWGKLWRHTKHG